jgi:hypothetical protein
VAWRVLVAWPNCTPGRPSGARPTTVRDRASRTSENKPSTHSVHKGQEGAGARWFRPDPMTLQRRAA